MHLFTKIELNQFVNKTVEKNNFWKAENLQSSLSTKLNRVENKEMNFSKS
jgi:hypothetical protein